MRPCLRLSTPRLAMLVILTLCLAQCRHCALKALKLRLFGKSAFYGSFTLVILASVGSLVVNRNFMARCVATMVLFQMCEFDTGNVGASERLPKSEMKI